MKILLIDAFNGAAGDMITGALLDAGANKDAVVKAMSSVVSKPDIDEVVKCGIRAVKVKTNAGTAHRTYDEVLEIIHKSSAEKCVKELAVDAFGIIAGAEERVHGKKPHFHEVGADDAIADVIGACTALCSLNPDKVIIKPINLGDGYVMSEHGRIPVPCPATVEILKQSKLMTIHGIGKDTGELCTPTGAALLSVFMKFCGVDKNTGTLTNYSNNKTNNAENSAKVFSQNEKEPQGRICNVGYGAGTRDFEDSANVLRVSILESESETQNYVDILETNVDDVTGEHLSYTMKRLMDAGARDVCTIPVIMKKGRNGFIIRVVSLPNDADKFIRILSEELGTLGIRHFKSVHRSVLTRTFEEVRLLINDATYIINVKVGWIEEAPVTFKAEFEDTKVCAEKTGLPIKQIAVMAESAALEKLLYES